MIKRTDLIEVMEAVRPGLQEGKTLIDQAECFVFMDGEVITFNDEVSVSCPCDFIDIEGSVRAKEMHAYLKRISDEFITLEQTTDQLRVKAGRKDSGFAFEAEVRLPVDAIPMPEDDEWHTLPKDFCEALTFVSFSIGKDYSNLVLTNAYIHDKCVDASDNMRMTRRLLGKKVPVPFFVPIRQLKTLVGYNPVEYAVVGDWVHFANDFGVIFSVLQVKGSFPDIGKYFETDGTEIKVPAEITEGAERAEIFLNSIVQDENLVEVSSDGTGMTITAKGPSGWTKEEFEYKGKEFKFSMPPKFIQEAFGLVDKAVLTESTIILNGKEFKHCSAIY